MLNIKRLLEEILNIKRVLKRHVVACSFYIFLICARLVFAKNFLLEPSVCISYWIIQMFVFKCLDSKKFLVLIWNYPLKNLKLIKEKHLLVFALM